MAKEFEKIDHVLFAGCVILMLAGFIMIYSSSSVLAYEKYGDGSYFFKRQVLWAFLGVIMAFVFYGMDPDKMKKLIILLLRGDA